MPADRGLIGRERERAALLAALAEARAGHGGLILLTGEAGAGKTRLAQAALSESQMLSLAAGASPETDSPYAPIVAVLRTYHRQRPEAFAGCGALTDYLALLMPELGAPPPGGDRGTLYEALRCALESIGRRGPAAIVLDDLQWADHATLELLPGLAEAFAAQPLLLVGLYRSDEISRGHPLRRLRLELRRRGRLREISLEPLNQAETALLAERGLGGRPSPALASTLFHRTQGLPFFAEELAAALAANGRVRPGRGGLELTGDDQLPIPDTVRDVVLLRAERLSPAARQAIEVAAVAGVRFDLDLVAALAGSEAGLSEAADLGLVVEAGPNQGAFRHALTREALYGDIPWTRRRALHRAVAARLEAAHVPPAAVAQHWRAGGDLARARQGLILAAERSAQVHAYRDAADASRQALELWPEGEDEEQRLEVLDRLGLCAQMTGELAEATRAWREAAEGHRRGEQWARLAEAQRRLASATSCRAPGSRPWRRARPRRKPSG